MDDTKKALLSIDIDTAALTQNADKAKEAVKALAEQLKELKTTGKESGEAFDKIVEQLKKAGEEAKKSTDALKEFGKGLKDSANAGAEGQKSLDNAMHKTMTTIASLDNQYKSGALKTRGQELSILITTYNALSVAERQNADVGGLLEQRIDKLMSSTRTLSSAYKNHNDNVKDGTTILERYRHTINEGSLNVKKAESAIQSLTHEYLTLTEAQKKNVDIGGKITNQIGALQANIKLLEGPTMKEYIQRTTDAMQNTTNFGDTIGQTAAKFNSIKDSLTSYKDSLNDYKDKVNNALAASNSYTSSTNKLSRGFQVLKTGTLVAAEGFDGLGKAITGTGFGLLLTILAAVIEHFKKFTPLVELSSRVTAALNGIFETLGNIADRLLAPILKIFTEPKKAISELGTLLMDNILNRFKAIGVIGESLWHILKGIFTLNGDEFNKGVKGMSDGVLQLGTGVTNLSGKMFGLVKEVGNAAKETYKLTGAQQELDRHIQTSAIKSAEDAATIAKKKAEMQHADVNTRKKLQAEIDAIQKAGTKRSQDEADEQLRITTGLVAAKHGIAVKELADLNAEGIEKLRISKHLTDEEVKNLQDALKNRSDALAKGFDQEAKITGEAQTKIAGQNKTADDKTAKAHEAFNESKKRMDLDSIKDANKREVAELEAGFQEQIKQFKKNSAAYLQLIKERDQKLKELAEKQAKDTKDKEAADDKALFDAQMQLKLAEAEGDFEKTQKLKLDQSKQDLEFDLKNSNLNEKQKQTLREQSALRDLEILKEGHEAKKAYLEKTLEDDKKLAEGETDPKKKQQAEIKVINDQYNLEVLLAKGNAAQLVEIEKKRADATAAIDKKAIDGKHRTFKEEFSLLVEKAKRYADDYTKVASLFGKNTAIAKSALLAKKAIAVAEIAVNTELAVSAQIVATKNQIKTDSDSPFPLSAFLIAKDIALGIADVASTIQNGAKQISTINSTSAPGFAKGGLYLSDGQGSYLTGPGSGTSDSINAKLSNGESIINARSTQMFAPILSAINQAGGGRAFNTSTQGNGYALGGLFNGSNALNDGSTDLATTRSLNDMAKTMAANMPRQILVVEDVQASLQNKAMLHSMSNF